MNARRIVAPLGVLAGGLLLAARASAACPPDSVQVGRLCVDRYEASVWRIADTLPNRDNLIAAIYAGMITSAAQLAGTQRRGEASDDYGNCVDTGGGACNKIYAVSIAGVKPSAYITWFQALAACTNSGKRLLTNQEWTAAALGSPDPGADNGVSDCNTFFNGSAADPTNTGARSACVSTRGAYDMVGNLFEWVAEWVPQATTCVGWGSLSNDSNCFAGASTNSGPGALARGGTFNSNAGAGPLTVVGSAPPALTGNTIGFRCAREL